MKVGIIYTFSEELITELLPITRELPQEAANQLLINFTLNKLNIPHELRGKLRTTIIHKETTDITLVKISQYLKLGEKPLCPDWYLLPEGAEYPQRTLNLEER